MTDIVIPLLRRSTNNFKELRFALRSLDTNLNGIGKLILVGGLPTWCNPDIFLSHADAFKKQDKEKNIADKLLVAIPHASDPFLYANDDHFILRPYDTAWFPYYWSLTFGGSGDYQKTIDNTKSLLGSDIVNYDVHCPMIIEHRRFMDRMPSQWAVWGYCMKTLYAQGLGGMECKDAKLRKPTDSFEGREWFSTADGVVRNDMERRLQKLFPNKSRWEL